MEPTSLAIFGASAAGALSRPTTKLIETVGAAIRVAFEPTRIRRKAAAEADAMTTIAEATGKAAEIVQRAAHRIANRELRRQQNIENITASASRFLPESVSDKPVSEDWIHHFFGACQDVSDEQMQSLWSQILAGEIAQPGHYSIRTLNAVKWLRKEDAAIFTNYCQFIWRLEGPPQSIFILLDSNALFPNINHVPEIRNIYATNGITPSARLHLRSLNLVETIGQEEMPIYSSPEKPSQWHYHDQSYRVIDPPGRVKIYGPDVPAEYLTDIGRELAPIAGAKPHERFCELIVGSLIDSGFDVVPN